MSPVGQRKRCSVFLAGTYLSVSIAASGARPLTVIDAHAAPAFTNTPRFDSFYDFQRSAFTQRIEESFIHQLKEPQKNDEVVKEDPAPMDDGMDARPGSRGSRDGITAGPNLNPGNGGGLFGGGRGPGGLFGGGGAGNSMLMAMLMQMLLQNGKNGSGNSINPATGQAQNPFNPITQPAEYQKWEQQNRELADARRRLAEAEKQKQQQEAQQKELAALRQKIAELEAKLNAQAKTPAGK